MAPAPPVGSFLRERKIIGDAFRGCGTLWYGDSILEMVMTASMRPVRCSAYLFALLLTGALAACSSNPPPGATGEAMRQQAQVEPSPGLRPGDAILLKVYREPGMSDTIQVDESGNATFPLLGTRKVTGISSDSLKRRLLDEYREYVTSPSIEIQVLRRISILGAVKQPGLYPVDPTVGLSDALAMAGGTTNIADRSDIRVIREGQLVLRTNLERSVEVGDLPIRSGDRIWVGEKSWFARNWQWLTGTVVSGTVLLITR